jgi:hypothetical protein
MVPPPELPEALEEELAASQAVDDGVIVTVTLEGAFVSETLDSALSHGRAMVTVDGASTANVARSVEVAWKVESG